MRDCFFDIQEKSFTVSKTCAIMGAITESFFTGRMMMKINWKKYVAFFCMALVLLAVFPSVMTVSAYSGGSGTANDPYLIATASDFLNIKNNPGKVFRQTCDISFDGISFVSTVY